ncbi:MAG: hypothetical protein DRI81_19480 [Chloroflexi bacterium]|nr:MAG: hypothetical protein DRI81_19480 [Chloroflexota bacterium]
MNRSQRGRRPKKDRHPIDEILRFQHRWIREFTEEHPGVWDIIGSDINVIQMTQLAVGHQPNLSMIEVHRLHMWQTVLNYQTQSVILILQHDLNTGLALLRMAAELSRDVHVIGSADARLSLWMEKNKKRHEYRKTFRFNRSLPQAEIVFGVYNLCSSFGVHGHVSNSMYSELAGRAGKDGKFALLDVSEIGILESVGTWLMGFAPMHHLCAREFFDNRLSNLTEEFSLFREFEMNSMELVQSYHASLKELKQEIKQETANLSKNGRVVRAKRAQPPPDNSAFGA